ncbi:Crp/Fnr family transcriptional regulator [Xylophilus sp.]|uniref:Crp/Fnr family transcriptional regulator n=1 Tax=Xylophilus sp. TaxID=2653893 RepID=UPI002D7F1E5C|nr:Crp/Fnr family transcriptional regulator [Xylophilus sp.]
MTAAPVGLAPTFHAPRPGAVALPGEDDAPAVSALGLRRVALFADLSDPQLASVARLCAWRHVEAGQTIDRCATGAVVAVVQGRVRISTVGAHGRELALADHAAGSCFGVVHLFDRAPVTLSAVALESGLLARIPHADFLALLRAEPRVAERVVREMGAVVQRMARRVIDLGTLGMASRLHTRLLALAQAAGIEGNQAILSPAPRHADLASTVATTREEITRELSRLTREGLLAKEGRTLVLRDVAALRARVAAARH